MQPKLKTSLAWQQAEMLLQPAFIRVVDNMRKQLEDSKWQGDYEEITEPYPGYILKLSYESYTKTVNLWDLCYRICFVTYPTTSIEDESCEVDIDTKLFDEAGQVNWHELETKTQDLIETIFNELPSAI